MKLSDIQKNKQATITETILLEKLGNLAQLGIGPLINILKQSTGSSRRGEMWTLEVGTKFSSQKIGSTSEIIDLGVVKDGLKSIRKAYKTHTDAEAFAMYIGGKPVLFAVYNDYDLAGASRVGILAYDLSAFQEVIDAMDTETHAAKSDYEKKYGRVQKTQVTSYREKERSQWDIERGKKEPERYQGSSVQTRDLAAKIDLIMNIAKRIDQPVTAKLVLRDVSAQEKRQKRYFTQQEIIHAVKDLKSRLAIYKNQKQPTANTIEDFISMSINKQAKKVQFAGSTYVLTAEAYDKINPSDLLNGKAFQIKYRTADPGSYDSLDITYAYDPKTNYLKPIYATWYDKRESANRYNRQEAVLDAVGYLKMKLTVSDLDNKDIVLKKILEKFKVNQFKEVLYLVDALRKAGKDWPELAAIEKSAKIEYEKQQKAKAT